MLGARKSKWEFITSNGGALSLGIAGAEGGSVTLEEPQTKRRVTFYYGALGVGPSFGVKLPKIGKMKMPGVTGSSESFTSAGLVYMTREYSGKELKERDIGGGFCFVEVGGGAAWGGAAYAKIFGMDDALVAASPLNPAFLRLAKESATGYLLFGGATFGMQAGGGLSGFAGVMYSR